ncbi:MAG: MunI family type II restriction endonuclease [Nitrospirae bacterium]|nr:MunI family type II restriction endonuclease [Nitrospirota bacterium]
MGTNELRKRDTWQDVSGSKAEKAEKNFKDIFEKHFENTDFKLRTKPKEFKNIYSSVKLSKEVLSKIYSPDETWTHGVIPDFAIDNIKTKKTLYIEVKRQDGWVEGKERKAGRGNAHERSCKFFTPGLLDVLRNTGKIGNDVLPFWVVFQGDIARDPKRVREIHFWYKGIEDHFFLWSDSSDEKSLLDHFEKKLKKHLL